VGVKDVEIPLSVPPLKNRFHPDALQTQFPQKLTQMEKKRRPQTEALPKFAVAGSEDSLKNEGPEWNYNSTDHHRIYILRKRGP